MGCLDDGHFEDGLKLGCGTSAAAAVAVATAKLGFEKEKETVEIEEAVRVLLKGLGEDVNREGIRKTPLRVAKALREGTRGYKQKVNEIVQGALFPESGLCKGVGYAGGVGGLVIVRDLDLFSYCESCLLPFQFKCHVGYIPSGQRVVGLSKLSRVADVFAKRLQEPQRLADEICSALHTEIKPTGVAVILQCFHIHFPNLESMFLDSNSRGWVKALVRAGSGVFEDKDAGAWADFLSLVKFRGIDVEKTVIKESAGDSWCPSCTSNARKSYGPVNPEMVSAVSSIIRSLGEDPSRKELVGTPSRFVKWLMNFENTSLNMKRNGYASGMVNNLTVNGQDNGKKESIHTELNLSLWSQCEHHLLPFYGVVHIGYFCAEGFSPIGRSILQSVVHFYGFKLQVQERLSRQIAETVSSLLGKDVIVVMEASHTCMISRGIEKFGSSTATIAALGRFSTDPVLRAMFLQMIPDTAISRE